jgi:alpha-amylase/alpha-mannosidase (GH57 family)
MRIMNPITFIFAVHNHQPIGNFDFVFEEVYRKAYKPFLDVLEEFPQIKVTQHYSGILLDWLGKHHPEFIDRLGKFIQSGQIEILSGAYYEAILSIIPPEDRIRQINKLSDRINSLFGVRPNGMWLAERVWEQAIVKEIAETGIKFLPIDEAHFKYAGKSESELYGYYTTEEQGRQLMFSQETKNSDTQYLLRR